METISLSTTTLKEAVSKARSVLEAGGIVLYPTDTVYGLAVDASNPDALKRLYALKGREEGKPVSILVPSVEAMSEYVIWNPRAKKLAQKFLPGALTLVLPALPHVLPDLQSNGVLGVRVPRDEFAIALATSFKCAYTSTSANLSGFPTLATPHDILEQFSDKKMAITLTIDDGPRTKTVASTVVSFENGDPQILREGAISRSELGLWS